MATSENSTEFNTSPIPHYLRASIRNTCKIYDEDKDIAYSLNDNIISLEEFFLDNVETLTANIFYDTFDLARGQAITFGGGVLKHIAPRSLNK